MHFRSLNFKEEKSNANSVKYLVEVKERMFACINP